MEELPAMSILDRIFYLIKKQRLTNKQVAIDLGLSPCYFAERKYQNREPSNKVCRQIADYFGVSVAWILTGKEDKNFLSKDMYVLMKEIESLSEDKKEFVIDTISSLLFDLKNYSVFVNCERSE